jgi:hypothetical protein
MGRSLQAKEDFLSAISCNSRDADGYANLSRLFATSAKRLGRHAVLDPTQGIPSQFLDIDALRSPPGPPRPVWSDPRKAPHYPGPGPGHAARLFPSAPRMAEHIAPGGPPMPPDPMRNGLPKSP